MGVLAWLFGGDKMAQIAKLEKQATAQKKENPDAAIRALQQAVALQQQVGMPPYVQLQTRLRMATVMYENKRFDDAEKLLMCELYAAQKMQRDKANGAPADFNRNLYCLRVYEKLRTCYEKEKQFAKALPFAAAEVYAKYENRCHDGYCDNPQPDFKAVEKCIAKIGNPELMQAVQALFAKCAAKPDSTKCWRMIDEIQKQLTT